MYCVKDSVSGNEKLLSPQDILKAEQNGCKIDGVVRVDGEVYFVPLTPEVAQFSKVSKGTPVRVRMAASLDFNQTLYAGCSYNKQAGNIIYHFFDGSALGGIFGVSSQFAINHRDELKFDFDNNDPMRVAELVRKAKESGNLKY